MSVELPRRSLDLNVTEEEEDEDAVVQSESDERVVARLFLAWDSGWVSGTWSESAGDWQDGEEQSVDPMTLGGNLDMWRTGGCGIVRLAGDL